jgi:hypothetical protein
MGWRGDWDEELGLVIFWSSRQCVLHSSGVVWLPMK